MKPNIFRYATSELSQDAFLCWIASCACPELESANPRLSEMGLRFLSLCFDAHESKERPGLIKKLDIYRQYLNVDVLININDKYSILIEDKVNTQQHSDQLSRYKTTIEKSSAPPYWLCITNPTIKAV